MIEHRAPVLVLGVGNLLLTDDAVGLHLLESLSQEAGDNPTFDFVDGGTQGIALLGYLSGRKRVVLLDAIGLGAQPGTVHVLRQDELEPLRARRAATAHEGNGLSLLDTARMLGESLPDVVVVGMEPGRVATGIGLSPEVERNMPAALIAARGILQEVVA